VRCRGGGRQEVGGAADRRARGVSERERERGRRSAEAGELGQAETGSCGPNWLQSWTEKENDPGE
jgi:hypothetical protein